MKLAYKSPNYRSGTLKVNKTKQGETIEQKIDRMMTSKEPIKDGAPSLYTERKDGVRPEYDIRTDRWEVANDGATKMQKSFKARREESANRRAEKDKPVQNDPLDKPAEPTKE